MPTGKDGSFHLNFQRMHAAERMKDGAKEKPKAKMGGTAIAEHEPEGDGAEKESIAHITIHKHADGSHSTETHDGEKMEHPTLGHALMHAANHHEPDAKHMHVKSDGMGAMESHHVGEDGNIEGPHDHENIEALKDHMGKFLDEEAHEGGGMEHEGGEHMGMEGMTGL